MVCDCEGVLTLSIIVSIMLMVRLRMITVFMIKSELMAMIMKKRTTMMKIVMRMLSMVIVAKVAIMLLTIPVCKYMKLPMSLVLSMIEMGCLWYYLGCDCCCR